MTVIYLDDYRKLGAKQVSTGSCQDSGAAPDASTIYSGQDVQTVWIDEIASQITPEVVKRFYMLSLPMVHDTDWVWTP